MSEATQMSSSPSLPAAPVNEQISLSCSAEYSCYPLTEQACWSIASFKAPFYEPTSRASVDIVAVIDKSGSMKGEKLHLVKKALLFVIDQLKDTDRLSVVTYDTNVYVNFELLFMTKEEKIKAKQLVNAITHGSSTNLCAGLLRGMDIIAETMSGGERSKVQSVLLFTDGLANQGLKTTPAIVQEIVRYQATPTDPAHSDQQIDAPSEASLRIVPSKAIKNKFEGTIYTFGFGASHDATLLEAISTQGGGVYYYIDTNEKIPESFADCLGGLLSVVAQNLSLSIELVGGNAVSQVHGNRAINWSTPNKSCSITMGDLQSEEERDVVLELRLPALASPQVDHVLKTTLSYFNVITSSLDTVTFDLHIDRKDGPQGPAKESVDVQRNRIVATNALNQAEKLADQDKLDDARKLLQDAIKTLESSASSQQDFCKALVSDLKRSLDSMKTVHAYRGHGKQYMHSKAQAHSVQRSNFVDDTSYYQNASKMAMRSKSKW